MDIGSKNEYPASALSNFHPYTFIFDGIECHSIEGVLQSFKFDKEVVQLEICKLVGYAAKKKGKIRNDAWKQVQKLWWRGIEYDRHGIEYQKLLNKLYIEVFTQCKDFRKALLSTGKAQLTHTIGRTNPYETILTQKEFVERLTKLRDRYSYFLKEKIKENS